MGSSVNVEDKDRVENKDQADIRTQSSEREKTERKRESLHSFLRVLSDPTVGLIPAIIRRNQSVGSGFGKWSQTRAFNSRRSIPFTVTTGFRGH